MPALSSHIQKYVCDTPCVVWEHPSFWIRKVYNKVNIKWVTLCVCVCVLLQPAKICHTHSHNVRNTRECEVWKTIVYKLQYNICRGHVNQKCPVFYQISIKYIRNKISTRYRCSHVLAVILFDWFKKIKNEAQRESAWCVCIHTCMC